MKWEALGHPNTEVRGRTSTLQTFVKPCLQAVNERVNSAIPRVFASNSVEQHPLHLSDAVDTIGQLAHSHTDSLGLAATTADRDTQSTRGLKAPKIADSSDNFHIFATGSKEERPQQLPNTVYTTGQQGSTRTVASEQTATVVNLVTQSMSALHSKKIANIGAISRTFATDSKEESQQQLSDTVCSIGQQENTCTGASEQTAAVANLATLSERFARRENR